MNALPYYFNLEVSKRAIDAGVHCCDLGGNTAIVAHVGSACPVLDQLGLAEAVIYRPNGTGGADLVARVLWDGWDEFARADEEAFAIGLELVRERAEGGDGSPLAVLLRESPGEG